MPLSDIKDHELVCKCDNGDVTVSIDHYLNNKSKYELAEGMKEKVKTAQKHMAESREKMKKEMLKNKSSSD